MSYSQRQTKPVLNIAPIEVPDVTIHAGVFPYDPKTGDDDLTQLRQKHRGTHTVARRNDLIMCLPRIQNAPKVGDDEQEIPLRENLSLLAALLRETLIDHFHALHRPVTRHRPITILGLDNLLKEALPQDLSAPSWLGLLPRYELDVRLFFLGNQKPCLGLALDSRTRRRISASSNELIAAGIDLHGLYVGRMCPNDDARLEPSFELLGRVSRLQGDEIQLDDAREGVPSVKTHECYPEPSSHTFANLLDQVFTDRAEQVRESLFQKAAARRVGPAKLQDIRKVIAYLQKQTLEVCPGVNLTIGSLLRGQFTSDIRNCP